MALFIMATLCNTNYSIRRLEKNKLRLKENEKWTKYGKKCMKLQRQFRMEGKYRIMLKPEKFPLRYIQHPVRFTQGYVLTPVLRWESVRKEMQFFR